MRTTAVLFSLLLCFAVGCGSPDSATVSATPQKLEVVDASTIDMLLGTKPVVLLDFSADY